MCLNETFLDLSIGEVLVEGYTLIGRRDRNDGRWRGGVAVYCAAQHADYITLLHISDESERLWVLVHSNLGPYLVAACMQGTCEAVT